MIHKKKKDAVEWLEFSLFSPFPELLHGVFTRHGGMSRGGYSSLNVGDNVEDDPHRVKENLEIVRKTLGIKAIYQGSQCHETNISIIEKESPLIIEACDGLITKEKGVGLMIKHADCQAGLFFDPKLEIIGAVHAGWKGNVKQIYTKMIEHFTMIGSHPKDLLVCISPSLGPDHAEFANYEKDFPSLLWPFQIKPNYFDLWAIAKRELIDAGIGEKHIEIASICTACHADDFFSYRRDHITGRNGSLIALKC